MTARTLNNEAFGPASPEQQEANIAEQQKPSSGTKTIGVLRQKP